MKAAVLKAFGSPLAIETVPEPVLGTGEVIVDVAASRVLAYANEVLSGERKYLLELPMVPGPGAIGRVRATGPDATRLRPGDWVYCDPTVRSRDNALLARHRPAGPDRRQRGRPAPAAIFPRRRLGRANARCRRKTRFRSATSTRRTPAAGARSARCWCPMAASSPRNCRPERSCWSMAPPAASAAPPSPSRWQWARNASSRPGVTSRRLTELTRRFGARVRTVPMRGHEADDRARILQAAPGPIDCVLDILPPAANAVQVRTAILAVRPYGRVVLMGGVGMLGGAGLELPYPWMMRNCITLRGQWMYPPHAATLMAGLIRSGLVDLDHFEIAAFGLDRANEAVAHAAANGGPFKMTVIEPQR